LPAGVPAEVAALGSPEQVHAPDQRQARRSRLLLRGLAAALGLTVLALAGLLWWAADNPAPHWPPPDVALGVAFAFAVLGLLTTATSFVPWGGRWGRRPPSWSTATPWSSCAPAGTALSPGSRSARNG
jgi:hypothetical protein